MPTLGRLHLITDPRPGLNPLAVVRATLRAGADAGALPVVQVRVPDEMTDREAYGFASRVVALCRDAGATCLVNDRLHVALAVGADGGHVGDHDLPVAAARRLLDATLPGGTDAPGTDAPGTDAPGTDAPGTDAPGTGPPGAGPPGAAVLGATAREPGAARAAVAAGASYLGVGPAYRSGSKDGLPEPIGPAGVAAVVAAVDVPVIAIGGVTAARVPELLAAGAYGVAVIGAINGAADPYAAALEFCRALSLAGHDPQPPAAPATEAAAAGAEAAAAGAEAAAAGAEAASGVAR